MSTLMMYRSRLTECLSEEGKCGEVLDTGDRSICNVSCIKVLGKSRVRIIRLIVEWTKDSR